MFLERTVWPAMACGPQWSVWSYGFRHVVSKRAYVSYTVRLLVSAFTFFAPWTPRGTLACRPHANVDPSHASVPPHANVDPRHVGVPPHGNVDLSHVGVPIHANVGRGTLAWIATTAWQKPR